MIHFVRGTIAIDCVKRALKISVTPGVGFVTPNMTPTITPKGATHAIAFPFPFLGPADSGEAKLIPLTENRFECDATVSKDHLAGLIAIAAQQKPIEIRVQENSSTPPAWELVGLAFPVS